MKPGPKTPTEIRREYEAIVTVWRRARRRVAADPANGLERLDEGRYFAMRQALAWACGEPWVSMSMSEHAAIIERVRRKTAAKKRRRA